MSEKTHIAWCDSTVNFWSGCTKVSPGCANCYAEARDARMMQEPVSHWGKGAKRLKHVGAVRAALALNKKPWICESCGGASDRLYDHSCTGRKEDECHTDNVKWHRRRIFSLSLGDWLDEEVPIEWLAEMLDTIRQCDLVTWILCTKRPELFRARMVEAMKWIENSDRPAKLDDCHLWILDWITGEKIPNHVWLLTSVENQEQADKRIPELLKIPAVCRGLSLEPLLGPVDLTNITDANRFPGCASFDVVNGRMIHHDDDMNWTNSEKVDWLIIGGESGSVARPCNVDWIRSLVRQGAAAHVPTFVKQLGTFIVCRNDNGFDGESQNEFPMDTHTRDLDPMEYQGAPVQVLLKDKKGGDPAEWPADLRVQEWPTGEVPVPVKKQGKTLREFHELTRIENKATSPVFNLRKLA